MDLKTRAVCKVWKQELFMDMGLETRVVCIDGSGN